MGRDNTQTDRLDPPEGETRYIAHLRIEKRVVGSTATSERPVGSYQATPPPAAKPGRSVSELSSITLSSDDLDVLITKLGQHLAIVGEKTVDLAEIMAGFNSVWDELRRMVAPVMDFGLTPAEEREADPDEPEPEPKAEKKEKKGKRTHMGDDGEV